MAGVNKKDHVHPSVSRCAACFCDCCCYHGKVGRASHASGFWKVHSTSEGKKASATRCEEPERQWCKVAMHEVSWARAGCC